jgi:hypothetical protein
MFVLLVDCVCPTTFTLHLLKDDALALAALLLEWLDALPDPVSDCRCGIRIVVFCLHDSADCFREKVIPFDMYNLLCEAEKIHLDDDLLFHSVHTLVNSMPRAHRTTLQYVSYILKSVVACGDLNQVALHALCAKVNHAFLLASTLTTNRWPPSS